MRRLAGSWWWRRELPITNGGHHAEAEHPQAQRHPAGHPLVCVAARGRLASAPEGIKAAPTLNLNWVNDQKLSGLVEKQLGTFDKQERISVFHAIEDILAENMYDIASVSSTLTWFGDGSLRNSQMPREAYNGATPYMKYWWFDKA